jgi:predicted nucleic acid-binding protein
VTFLDTGFLFALVSERDAHHARVVEVFKRHQDQTYSFVDCLSFVVMEKAGIREALAVDSDFTHRFVARPGPLGR